MRRYICAALAVLIIFCTSVHAADTSDPLTGTAAGTEETTEEEITDPEPETEDDDGTETAQTFLNINIYMFAGGVILFIICTVIYLVMKAKKKMTNTENNG